jgi:hypothetical protein
MRGTSAPTRGRTAAPSRCGWQALGRSTRLKRAPPGVPGSVTGGRMRGWGELVRKGGFEPPRREPPPPQDGVSTSSTTSARENQASHNMLHLPVALSTLLAVPAKTPTKKEKLPLRGLPPSGIVGGARQPPAPASLPGLPPEAASRRPAGARPEGARRRPAPGPPELARARHGACGRAAARRARGTGRGSRAIPA